MFQILQKESYFDSREESAEFIIARHTGQVLNFEAFNPPPKHSQARIAWIVAQQRSSASKLTIFD